MKQLYFSIVFICAFGMAKAQCMFIYASEKIKGVEIPIERVEFEVTINDTLKKKCTSKNDGSLGRINVDRGTYKVKITTDEFSDGISEEVTVNESRTTNIIINVVRLTPAQVEEKKKGKK